MSRSLKIDLPSDYEIDQGDTDSRWFDRFAKELEKQQRTAVEVARERAPSVADQMNSIMNGRVSPYRSVEEAVQAYQKRTGVDEYRKRIIAQEIIEAGLVRTAEDEQEEKEEDSEKKILNPKL